jgi:hypothetical protein
MGCNAPSLLILLVLSPIRPRRDQSSKRERNERDPHQVKHITLRLSELHLIHTFASIPMHWNIIDISDRTVFRQLIYENWEGLTESSSFEHLAVLLLRSGEHLSDGRRVAETSCSLRRVDGRYRAESYIIL